MTIKSICDKCKKEVVKESYIHDHVEVEYSYECEHCGYYEHWAYGTMVMTREEME